MSIIIKKREEWKDQGVMKSSCAEPWVIDDDSLRIQ